MNNLDTGPDSNNDSSIIEEDLQITGESDKVIDRISNVVGVEKIKGFIEEVGKSVETRRAFSEIDNTKRSSEDIWNAKFLEFRDIVRKEENLTLKEYLRWVYSQTKEKGRMGSIGLDTATLWHTPDILTSSTTHDYFYNSFVYNPLSKSETETQEFRDIQERYQMRILSLAKDYPSNTIHLQSIGKTGNTIEELERYHNSPYDDFLHFNSDKFKDEDTIRCYISFNATAAPDEGIKVWQKALEESGLKDILYFKVCTKINDKPRRDNIVIYKNKSIPDDKFKDLLERFTNECSTHKNEKGSILASDNQMLPYTKKIAQGISIAAEPSSMNLYLKVANKNNEGQHSYGTFIDRMLQLSIVVAHKRLLSEKGNYKTETKKAFKEFMLLAKINPDTMMPAKYGNKLPSWAYLYNK